MRAFTVPSSRQPDTAYTVRLYTGIETEFGQNEWECTCPHYRYRHTHCRHIDYARSAFADGYSGGPGTDPFPLSAPHANAAQLRGKG